MTLAEFNANNTQALDTLLSKHGVELHEFSDELYKAFGEASKDVLATAGASDAVSGKVYASFLAFRKKSLRWSDLSDRSYMNKRALTDFG
jgi:TRAP-type mannitol/chloroaromatic compound transport system substrate-binding protein